MKFILDSTAHERSLLDEARRLLDEPQLSPELATAQAAALAAIVQAEALTRIATALEKLSGCVENLTTGETIFNTFDNSRRL